MRWQIPAVYLTLTTNKATPMQTQNKVVQINPDQARIDAAVKLATETTIATATLAERKRYLAISALSQPGLEAQVQAALESGVSAGDFALAIMTAQREKKPQPAINAQAIYENTNKPKG